MVSAGSGGSDTCSRLESSAYSAASAIAWGGRGRGCPPTGGGEPDRGVRGMAGRSRDGCVCGHRSSGAWRVRMRLAAVVAVPVHRNVRRPALARRVGGMARDSAGAWSRSPAPAASGVGWRGRGYPFTGTSAGLRRVVGWPPSGTLGGGGPASTGGAAARRGMRWRSCCRRSTARLRRGCAASHLGRQHRLGRLGRRQRHRHQRAERHRPRCLSSRASAWLSPSCQRTKRRRVAVPTDREIILYSVFKYSSTR